MSKTTVLIVEDEAIIAADLEAKLALLGYQVVGIAASGEDAVQMAGRLIPEVVLMDIRLQGSMDGIEAAEAIRRSVDLPVIYLTAHSDSATLARAKISEPFGYLLKPFEEREVAIAIELALYKHQAQRHLREQREWLRVTLASIGDAVITCDTGGRTTYLNAVAESLTGWSKEEAKERGIGEVFRLMDEATGRPAEDPVAYVLRERRTKIMTNHTALITRDGRTIPIEDSAAPILNDQGGVIGAVLVFHDVTEKRRAQEALQATNDELAAANEELRAQAEELLAARKSADAATRAKGLFLANMSHELRTPMTGVIGMLDVVLSGELDPSQRDCLVAAQGAAGSMVTILNDILDMTKIETGILSLVDEPFSLRKTVKGAFDILLPAARGKHLEFELLVAEDVPDLVRGDQTRLSQVLNNLAGNAVKFTEKGRVAIGVRAGAPGTDGRSMFTFTVTDTGIGIPESKRPLLFHKFSQVDDSHSREYGGAGLGLAICREIVERMGGTIGFESEDGKGSSFSFSIPLAVATGRQVDSHDEPGKARIPLERLLPKGKIQPKLLLVEDDAVIRKTLLMMLSRCNYQIDCAENGRQAIEAWKSGRYDLILMDVQMPVLDGFEATSIIRAIEEAEGGHVPIMAMTAHALKEDEAKCLAAGMDAYISKPIDFSQTLRKIAEILKNR